MPNEPTEVNEPTSRERGSVMRPGEMAAALKVIRAKYSVEHGDVVLALIPMAKYAGHHTMRLPRAAYFKGLIAGLSYDTTDENYPECPYDKKQLPNFMSGDNDPREAWRDGSRDGLRIRQIVLRPEAYLLEPGLLWCEYKALTPELRSAHDARTMALAHAAVSV